MTSGGAAASAALGGRHHARRDDRPPGRSRGGCATSGSPAERRKVRGHSSSIIESMSSDRRKATRYEIPFIPVQLADVDGEMIDLSLTGAAVLHRSPVREGVCTLVFPSYGGIYVPCRVLRSIVQVRRELGAPEYIYRSA